MERSIFSFPAHLNVNVKSPCSFVDASRTMKEPSGVSRSFSFTSSLRENQLTVNRSDIPICQTIKTHILRAHLSVCKTDCISETGLLKSRYTTCLCLPSTIQRPVANTWAAQGSCCSWWRTLALWTWEGELDSK